MIDATLDKINRIVPQKWQWVLNHEGFRKYFKNTGWMFFGQMFSLLVSFFIGAWLARYLGPENYGVFNYAVAFAGLFGFIAPLGVDAILNRDLIAHPEKRDELIGTAFVLKLIGGILAFLSASVAAYFLETSYLVKWIVIIFSLNFVFYSFQAFSIYFASIVQSKKNVKSQFLASFIASILKVILICSKLGIIWLAVIFLLEIIIQSLGYFVNYNRAHLYIKNLKFNKNLALSILSKSWLLMLASAASFIYLKIDQVILGRILGAEDVGLYSAAVKLADIWYFLPGIICSSVFPAIINAKKQNEVIYKRRLKSLYFLMFTLSACIAGAVSIFAKSLMLLVFGPDYMHGVSALQIYVWAGVGFFVGVAVNQYLMSENMLRTIFWLNIVTMAVNIILNIYLIPLLGMNGAAVATFVSYSILPFSVLSFNNFLKQKIN